MKDYIKYIPRTVFAAGIVLAASLSAEEAASQGTNINEQQRQSQQSSRTVDKSATESTTRHANLRPMMASEVLGMNIDTADNEEIGEIDDIYVDSHTGEVLAMVVSTGGFLGFGQQKSLISPKDLRLNAERTHMQTGISKDQIRNAPRYKKGEKTGFDQVQPLGATASDWEQSTQRSDPPQSEQDASDRRRTGEERTDRTEGEQDASNPQTTGQERMERTNRSEDDQSEVHALAVSELIEMNVENRQGESVGNVDEAFLDLENWEVAGVVVSTGGFLGTGDRKTLFGMREMSFDSANEMVILDYNRNQISAFPEFKPDDQSVFEDLRERMDSLDSNSTRSAAVQQ